jgi:hypothetical protein
MKKTLHVAVMMVAVAIVVIQGIIIVAENPTIKNGSINRSTNNNRIVNMKNAIGTIDIEKKITIFVLRFSYERN